MNDRKAEPQAADQKKGVDPIIRTLKQADRDLVTVREIIRDALQQPHPERKIVISAARIRLEAALTAIKNVEEASGK